MGTRPSSTSIPSIRCAPSSGLIQRYLHRHRRTRSPATTIAASHIIAVRLSASRPWLPRWSALVDIGRARDVNCTELAVGTPEHRLQTQTEREPWVLGNPKRLSKLQTRYLRIDGFSRIGHPRVRASGPLEVARARRLLRYVMIQKLRPAPIRLQ